ncbi:adenylate/guanylate cyclase domain-containing protein [Kitasatospora mediocidica]|uniref:adenylate/guanylate cyclase domain-containing protein n=1 Tax=Kitasatospora mediocidica TaxID=58352 RepID=UPI00056AC3CD|nr:adenylate/guanylate cyclase domain-containing protein [Kitasatospora mediocidica]
MADDDGGAPEESPHGSAEAQHHGAEPEDADGTVALDLERLILDAPRRYTPYQAARAAEVPMELATRFWRAMGFPDIGQSRALNDSDVIALRRLAGLVESGLLSEPMAIQVARSTGQTTARLAGWQMDTFLDNLTQAVEPGLTRADVAYPLVELLLPELEQFLVYVWRRQLAAVTGRVVQAAEDTEIISGRLAVGFADLVGFTRLSRRLEEEELGELVETFESTCSDLIAGQGGRLIKTLGDEILYVSEDPVTAAEIALSLVDTLTKDDTMPALRVGMAFGAVTSRMGDVFGTTVNLASRLTSIAQRDAVLIDGEFAIALEQAGAGTQGAVDGSGSAQAQLAEALAAASGAPLGSMGAQPQAAGGGPRFQLQPMWRRPVRGLGLVEPWLLSRRSRTPNG